MDAAFLRNILIVKRWAKRRMVRLEYIQSGKFLPVLELEILEVGAHHELVSQLRLVFLTSQCLLEGSALIQLLQHLPCIVDHL